MIIDIFNDMLFIYEEMFGLFVLFYKFKMDDEVIVLVNDIDFGFVLYFYSKDFLCVWKVME